MRIQIMILGFKGLNRRRYMRRFAIKTLLRQQNCNDLHLLCCSAVLRCKWSSRIVLCNIALSGIRSFRPKVDSPNGSSPAIKTIRAMCICHSYSLKKSHKREKTMTAIQA